MTAHEEFAGITTPPDDQRHVQQVIDHIAHLRDDQVKKIRDALNMWDRAARRDDSLVPPPGRAPRRRPRPDSCPNCGASVSSYTGTYCHECGEQL